MTAESEGNARATIYEEINKQFFCQIVVAEAFKLVRNQNESNATAHLQPSLVEGLF